MKISIYCLLLVITQVSSITYNRRAKDEDVDVQWFYEIGATEIFFKMQSPFPVGYVAIGLNNKSSMAGMDCVVGWIDKDGVPHLEDRHGIGERDEPLKDKHQDYTLISAKSDKNEGLVIEFKRKIKNCDYEDYKFSNEDHTYLMYSFNSNNPKKEGDNYRLEYHGLNHYTSREYILNTAKAIDVGKVKPDDTTYVYNVTYTNFIIPSNKVTTYRCQVYEVPAEYEKNPTYFIGWRPLINPGHEKYFHHAAIGQCRGNVVELKAKVLKGGWDCSTPMEFMELLGCLPLLISFVVGSPGEFYPQDLAYSFGEKSGGSHFLFYQTHYTNENLDKNVADSSGLQLFLTTKKRENIAGTLLSLSSIDHKMALPPNQPAFLSPVICPPACTSMYPPEGVTVFGILSHMHLLGIKFKVRHFDVNGIERPPIFEDNHYMFNNQEPFMLPERRKIYPGESLLTECYYDTRNRKETALGGLSTFEEMCSSVLYIYPVAKSFSVCAFGLEEHSEAAFFGVKAFNETTKIVSAPPELNGMSLPEIIQKYKWTNEKVNEFQELTKSGTMAGACLGVGGSMLGGFGGNLKITKEYKRPKDECNC